MKETFAFLIKITLIFSIIGISVLALLLHTDPETTNVLIGSNTTLGVITTGVFVVEHTSGKKH